MSVVSATRIGKTLSVDNEYYIPIGNLTGLIFALNSTTNQLSTASWANFGSRYLSSVNAAGQGLLKDMGRPYVSAGRTFRRVQLVVPQSTGTVSTNGVNGQTGTTPTQDFLTGYIEVGFPETSASLPTPVAKWGR
uniref:Uncharacterized protein n=1 Tax=viral metagenome TaxID=1070528 RepID=A0A6C0BI79_9ZZZZ